MEHNEGDLAMPKKAGEKFFVDIESYLKFHPKPSVVMRPDAIYRPAKDEQ